MYTDLKIYNRDMSGDLGKFRLVRLIMSTNISALYTRTHYEQTRIITTSYLG